MKKRVAVILLNAPGYAERYLKDCIMGLRTQDYTGEIKIFIIDNKTSEDSFKFLSTNASEAELILNKDNRGFAGGNNDAMRQAILEGFDYVFLLNLDTEIESSCIRKLVEVFQEDKNIRAVQARLMLHPAKNKINSLGNKTHFLGFGYGEGYKGVVEDYKLKTVNDICYPSGAAVMFSCEVLKKIGLFDEEFWMYNEDQDLGWRVWLAGYRCVMAEKAVVYHKYEFNRSVQKYYWMDRNRIIAILKNYHFLTLVLIFPSFLVMEIGLIIFSLKSGWWQEKKKVWLYFLRPRTWVYLLRARRQSQKIRVKKDAEIVSQFTGVITHQEVNDMKLKLINPFFNLYWKICKFIIIW